MHGCHPVTDHPNSSFGACMPIPTACRCSSRPRRPNCSLPAGQPTWPNALVLKWPRGRLGRELDQQGEIHSLFAGYLDESAALAREVGYRGTYLLASPDKAKAPQVSDFEQALATALSQRRIATGGYRIADALVSAIATSHAPNWACPAPQA